MKKKYNVSITDLLNSTYKVEGYEINDYSDNSEEDYSSYPSPELYSDWTNLVNIYYDSKSYVEETEEQRLSRLAKEKALNRNNKINQVLGDNG
jgi:hypothetical protein